MGLLGWSRGMGHDTGCNWVSRDFSFAHSKRCSRPKKVVNFAASLARDGSVGVFGVTRNPGQAL